MHTTLTPGRPAGQREQLAGQGAAADDDEARRRLAAAARLAWRALGGCVRPHWRGAHR